MAEESQKPRGLMMRYDPAYERKEWVVQRIGWGLMLLLCLAALSGVLSDGPASSAQAGKVGDRLYLKYERYARHQAPFTLKVYCRPEGAKNFSLAFTRAFLEKHEVREIQPEPESTVIDGERCHFMFNGTGGAEQLVTFRLEAVGIGQVQNEITLDGNITRKMEQFIWP